MSKRTEVVYREIRRQIVTGDLTPGSQVKEDQVASALGVSRTPVRAALQRLIDDGLLVSYRGRGAFVTEWTVSDVNEIFELRILLESHAAGLAAQNASKEQIESLRTSTETMRRLVRDKPPNHLADLQAANTSFHRTVLAASGSPRLRALAEALLDIPITINFYIYNEDDLQRSIQHHLDLIMAIESRHESLAQQIMGTHVRIASLAFKRSRGNGVVQLHPADQSDDPP